MSRQERREDLLHELEEMQQRCNVDPAYAEECIARASAGRRLIEADPDAALQSFARLAASFPVDERERVMSMCIRHVRRVQNGNPEQEEETE